MVKYKFILKLKGETQSPVLWFVCVGQGLKGSAMTQKETDSDLCEL